MALHDLVHLGAGAEITPDTKIVGLTETWSAETRAGFRTLMLPSWALQVPVTICGDQFAATLEWGTEVRGRYEIVVPPQLIVMSWDADDGNIPVPGHPLTGYLRVYPHGDGSRVVVHQVVSTSDRATFMEGAWAMVLGRLKTNIVSALAGSAPPQRQRRAAPRRLPWIR